MSLSPGLSPQHRRRLSHRFCGSRDVPPCFLHISTKNNSTMVGVRGTNTRSGSGSGGHPGIEAPRHEVASLGRETSRCPPSSRSVRRSGGGAWHADGRGVRACAPDRERRVGADHRSELVMADEPSRRSCLRPWRTMALSPHGARSLPTRRPCSRFSVPGRLVTHVTAKVALEPRSGQYVFGLGGVQGYQGSSTSGFGWRGAVKHPHSVTQRANRTRSRSDICVTATCEDHPRRAHAKVGPGTRGAEAPAPSRDGVVRGEPLRRGADPVGVENAFRGEVCGRRASRSPSGRYLRRPSPSGGVLG